ncbi:MAG: hypothetical protein SV760_10020, partial [Halobacteria archaeon]|nr:hypothetical protein [Halobacteria archaeon]
MEVLVVGGAGEMGGWVVDFLTDRGFDVDVSDPEADPHSLPESVENVPLEDADGYDIVVVGVPIGVTA